ncbi:mandelate racemase/muconate lactonizing enzyme family protein [Chitinophaga alhagiae]|uniref:mandelate racemase/muconate lactonizing enzyme family protein n=1 Tax=Chitinophaga alhagiae TaxID=2203219 RepID=UPI000E5AFBA5|nr:mandelate racemase/muconate lactonizing enzyme family protein [Chitinophaga alhagiae]
MYRRDFIRAAGIMAMPAPHLAPAAAPPRIRVVKAAARFEREPLLRPFGFKGNYLTELWQVATRLTAASGNSGIGLATQSVLYGDAELFAAHTELKGNAMMFALVQETLDIVKATPFTTPIDLQEKILPRVIAAGKEITGRQQLHYNFVLNALVSIDNAAWLLYAAENNCRTFDEMIPAPYRAALGYRNKQIAVLFQVSYNMPVADIVKAVKDGYFIIKIKTGSPGSQEEMLAFDMARLTEIHNALKDLPQPHTAHGNIWYTMDANGRYAEKDTLRRYLDHAKSIGAFDRILVYEEPFREDMREPVGDLGVRLGADESVHSERDALQRLQQGYSVLVLKGIAKTLSLSMRIAKLAEEKKVPCLCADLTVNPVLVDWHKNLAARLAPFPGVGMGLMETNGDMNYRHWAEMKGYLPAEGASWTDAQQGVFNLGADFYAGSGGIFKPSRHYEDLFK